MKHFTIRAFLLAALASGLGLTAVAVDNVEAAPASSTKDALTAARFSITIDGYEIASFSELQGTSAVESVEFADGSEADALPTILPGKRLPPTVTLKRGLTRNVELWAWHEAVRLGDVAAARKSAELVAYGDNGQPIARFYLENAWPAKIEIGALKAGASEVLMETVTLVCEHIQRVAP